MQEEQKETGIDGFTERAIMSLVMEAVELREATMRFSAVVTALALVYGVSTEV